MVRSCRTYARVSSFGFKNHVRPDLVTHAQQAAWSCVVGPNAPIQTIALRSFP